jgi:hypothetical protein
MLQRLGPHSRLPLPLFFLCAFIRSWNPRGSLLALIVKLTLGVVLLPGGLSVTILRPHLTLAHRCLKDWRLSANQAEIEMFRDSSSWRQCIWERVPASCILKTRWQSSESWVERSKRGGVILGSGSQWGLGETPKDIIWFLLESHINCGRLWRTVRIAGPISTSSSQISHPLVILFAVE